MTTSPGRRAMIAKVHVAKKALGLADDDYRAVVERATGKNSSGDCTEQQLVALLAEFTRLGWTATSPTRVTSAKPWTRMIYGIWRELQPLLDNATEETLRAFVRRQTRSLKNPDGIADPKWLDANDGTKVIQGLQGWLANVRAKPKTQPETEDA